MAVVSRPGYKEVRRPVRDGGPAGIDPTATARSSVDPPETTFDSKLSVIDHSGIQRATALSAEHVLPTSVVRNAQHKRQPMSTTATDRRLVTILLVALGALVVLPLLFMGGGMMGYMGPGMMGGMWGGTWGDGGAVPGWLYVVGIVMRLLFLAVVVGAGYLVYRLVVDRTDEDDALAELRLAYARGDLDDDEYERRREVLERDRP
jgi:putative membrane protein